MNEVTCSVTNENPIHKINNELRLKRNNLDKSSDFQNSGSAAWNARTVEYIFTNCQRGVSANKIDFQIALPVSNFHHSYNGGKELSQLEDQWSKEFSCSYKNKSADVVKPGRSKHEKCLINFHDKHFSPHNNIPHHQKHIYPYEKVDHDSSPFSDDWETQFKLIENQLINELRIENNLEEKTIGYEYVAEYEETIGFKHKLLTISQTYHFLKSNSFLCERDPYKIGCVLMENGSNLNDVVMAFEAAISQDPNHSNAWLKLGIVNIENEDESRGEQALRNCLSLDPNNTSAMESLAIHFINQQNELESLKYFYQWITSKFSEFLHLFAGEDKKNIHEIPEKSYIVHILESLLSVRITKTDRFDIYSVLSVLYYSDQKIQQSLESLELLISEKPNNGILWNRYGAILANTKSYHSAINAYNKSKQLRPNFTRVRYNLAIAYLNEGDYVRASRMLIEVILLRINGCKQSKAKMQSKFMQNLKNTLIALKRFDLLDDLLKSSHDVKLLLSTLKDIYKKIG